MDIATASSSLVIIGLVGLAGRAWADALSLNQTLQAWADKYDAGSAMFKLLSCEFCHTGHMCLVLTTLLTVAGVYPWWFFPVAFLASWKVGDLIPGA